jgi:hypothetical protein
MRSVDTPSFMAGRKRRSPLGTDLARRFDMIRIEDLNIKGMLVG